VCAEIVREFGEKLRPRASTVNVIGAGGAGSAVGGSGMRVGAGCGATTVAASVACGGRGTVAGGAWVAGTEVTVAIAAATGTSAVGKGVEASAWAVGDGGTCTWLPPQAIAPIRTMTTKQK
jgi:hypothetical protein